MNAQKVIINQPTSGRRIVMGIDVETGNRSKPLIYDPFKHGSVERKELKAAKLSAKQHKNFNPKPRTISSNKFN